MPNAYHQQGGSINRNQQYPFNNNNNTNTRYLPSENGFINSNNIMINQRNNNDQGGFDAPHIQNGYVNQRNPQGQCKLNEKLFSLILGLPKFVSKI
jgi:hypothetical protein